MTVVGYTEFDAAGEPVAGVRVSARLRASSRWLTDRTGEIIERVTTVSGEDGTWQLELTPTGELQDAGATYELVVGTGQYSITVPESGGPYRYPDLVAGDPADTPAAPGLVSQDANNALVLHSDGLFVPVGGGGGTQGPAGTPGQPRFYGTTDPGLIGSAVSGDLYLNTSTGQLFQFG